MATLLKIHYETASLLAPEPPDSLPTVPVIPHLSTTFSGTASVSPESVYVCRNMLSVRIKQWREYFKYLMTDLKDGGVRARLNIQKTQQFIATNIRLQESCYVLIIFCA